jgi:hypothetical protein
MRSGSDYALSMPERREADDEAGLPHHICLIVTPGEPLSITEV